jgi:hypothetical protein
MLLPSQQGGNIIKEFSTNVAFGEPLWLSSKMVKMRK